LVIEQVTWIVSAHYRYVVILFSNHLNVKRYGQHNKSGYANLCYFKSYNLFIYCMHKQRQLDNYINDIFVVVDFLNHLN